MPNTLHSSNRLFLAYCQANGLKPDEPQDVAEFHDWLVKQAKQYESLHGEIKEFDDFIEWVENEAPMAST